MSSGEFFVHPSALCETDRVGSGTRIWAFSHVLAGAIIGRDCNICESVFIEATVMVGDRVTIKNGVQLWDGVRVEDDAFVGPNATFTNDPRPRSRRRLSEYPQTIVGRGASVGANATLLPGVHIGMWAMVGAGSVVTRNVPPYALVRGNPARIVGYVDHSGFRTSAKSEISSSKTNAATSPQTLVGGATLYSLPVHEDMRGQLTVAELVDITGFPSPRRMFFVSNVPTADIRGEHAHRECHQLLFCVAGSISVRVDDGVSGAEVTLDAPSKALHVPPSVWCEQFRFSSESVLVVLASHEYDSGDYIRDYAQFLRYRQSLKDDCPRTNDEPRGVDVQLT